MKHFRFSIIFTVICLALSAWWGFSHGPEAGVQAMLRVLLITTILAVMEVSLSFDNAVVNASILRHWDEFWKKIFLTVGILIAVFGMRLIFPIVIVAITADMGMVEVVQMALNDPVQYSEKLLAHHAEIAAFGGMFLLLVFLNFLFDDGNHTKSLIQDFLDNRLIDSTMFQIAMQQADCPLNFLLSWLKYLHMQTEQWHFHITLPMLTVQQV